jgi:hypothetical protein
VIQQVRPKLACVRCDKIVQAEAPSRPIEREFGRLAAVGEGFACLFLCVSLL